MWLDRRTLAEQFDAVADFSLRRNPSGPWSYGGAARPSDFVALNYCYRGSPELGWIPSPELAFPKVGRNESGKFVHSGGDYFPEDALFLCPGTTYGSATPWAVVRFTAPVEGTYRFRGSFEALSLGYGGTTQSIWCAGRNLAENTFGKAHGQVWEFEVEQSLRSGESVDILVGPSPNGDNANDTTGLMLIVERYVVSSLLWPLGSVVAALVALVSFRRRRRSLRPLNS